MRWAIPRARCVQTLCGLGEVGHSQAGWRGGVDPAVPACRWSQESLQLASEEASR